MRMENDRFERCLLLDYYGELITDKQRQCCDLHFNEDLSLGEIAEHMGISRQGVWDNIRRGESALEAIENKTGLIRRFSGNRRKLDLILADLERIAELTDGEAKRLAESAMREIGTMKLEV